MIPHIPWYITLIVLVTQPLIGYTVWRIVAGAAPRAVRLGLAVALTAWLGLALVLAPAPATVAGRNAFYVNPLIPSFALAAFVAVLAGLTLFPALRQAVAVASVPALIGVQVYRVIGVLFIILLAQGQLPVHFAEPAGWGDIFVGLTAVPVAIALARQLAGARALAVAWNVFGLLDLMVAVGMGTGVLAPYLLPGVDARVPAAAAMGVFPLILIPTVVVPLSVILHLTALARLARAAPAGARLMAKPAA
jgi:hypothetical protein